MSVDKRAFDSLAQKVAGLERDISVLKRAGVVIPTHSISDLPKAVLHGSLILVPDASAGTVLAMSDGTHWLELKPAGVIS